MKITSLFTCALLALAAPATAAFDLKITEMWMGNEPGSNLTEDWVEITNMGDTAWVEAVDGGLWFDDGSFDASAADPMSGIPSIAPGEAVIYVNGDAAAIDEFLSVWGLAAGSLQIGIHDGSGLGQGGDGVAIFRSVAQPTIDDIVDAQEYDDASLNGGQSWDVLVGGFSTIGNSSGAFQSALSNDEGQFAIASPPGTLVPEPTAAVLGMIALGAFAGARRS
ncbi:hypothetical protein [Botrimarina mediterranea]|uniref:LTD domain-containing protein n=1 Tax=Botrimarina mediterranea TaxID=2528022 RepID=A0A518K3T7_9BACT|nr:hypothetical protein [Botrimarina mediterranea]QDV72439.1 hypothetical protein Spa11_06150 [Botrimarina mediterranea]QDV76985.1 hypothetical protein K2D_05700 [Planctomycetes bacterium K2D]